MLSNISWNRFLKVFTKQDYVQHFLDYILEDQLKWQCNIFSRIFVSASLVEIFNLIGYANTFFLFSFATEGRVTTTAWTNYRGPVLPNLVGFLRVLRSLCRALTILFSYKDWVLVPIKMNFIGVEPWAWSDHYTTEAPMEYATTNVMLYRIVNGYEDSCFKFRLQLHACMLWLTSMPRVCWVYGYMFNNQWLLLNQYLKLPLCRMTHWLCNFHMK